MPVDLFSSVLGNPILYATLCAFLAFVVLAAIMAAHPGRQLQAVAVALLATGAWATLVWLISLWAIDLSIKWQAVIKLGVLLIVPPTAIWVLSRPATRPLVARFLNTPMLYAIAVLSFISVALQHGAQVIPSQAATSHASHDTYYVVASFHYLLTLTATFGILGLLYTVARKNGQPLYPEWAGQLQFWALFVGTYLALFGPQILGRQAMPRRYADYPDAFATWNLISVFGSGLALGSFLCFAGILTYALFTHRRTG